MINPAIFRAYDIRGNGTTDLTPEVAYKVGFCFAQAVIADHDGPKQPVICVGKDGRLSSDSLCGALLQGIKAAGVKVKYIGLTATPVLYFADKIFSADGSIMVTGSHNPKDDNGFKMLKANAPFFGSMIQELKTQIEELAYITINLNNTYEEEIIDISEQYIERILLSSKINQNLKIAFDPANGAGSELVAMLCKKLSCKTFIINEKIDGNFPAHDPDPTIAKNLEQLKAFVLANSCDVGIGFDGDADRIGVITKEGQFIPGDQLLCLYAKDVISKNPGAKIIADVKASSVLFDYVKKLGGVPIMWKTGHSFIKAKMKETGAKLAGEMSGHIFFADNYYGYDDALYAAIRLINIISNSSKTLDELLNVLPKVFNTPEIKLPAKDEVKFAIIEEIKALAIVNNMKFIDIDGIRVDNEHGWWLLRASNTAAYIIARCESPTQKGLELVKQNLNQILAPYNYKLN